MKPAQRGYTLLELTLTLLILGVLGIVLLRWSSSLHSERQYQAQRDLLQRADDALVAHAVGKARLPCPAAAADGIERCDGRASGPLPWLTLGLPDARAASIQYSVLSGDSRDLSAAGIQRSAVLRALAAGNTLMASVQVPLGSPYNHLDLCRALDQRSAPVPVPAYALALPGDSALTDAPPARTVTTAQLWSRLRCSDAVGPALQAHPNVAAAATVSTLAMSDYTEQMAIFHDLANAAHVSAQSAMFSAAGQITGASGGLFDTIGESWATYGVWTWRIKPAIGAMATAATNLISAATFLGLSQTYQSRANSLQKEFNDRFPGQSRALETELIQAAERADRLGLYPDAEVRQAVLDSSAP